MIKAANKASRTAVKVDRTSKIATAVDNRVNRIAARAANKASKTAAKAGNKASKTAARAAKTTSTTVRSDEEPARTAQARLTR